MPTLARRAEAVALLAVISARWRGTPRRRQARAARENAALRTMKSMIDTAAPACPSRPRSSWGRRISVRPRGSSWCIAGSVGAAALYAAREATPRSRRAADLREGAARHRPCRVGPASRRSLPQMEVRDDAELGARRGPACAQCPNAPSPCWARRVAKFLRTRCSARRPLAAIVPLWGERAQKPLVDALEYAEEPTRDRRAQRASSAPCDRRITSCRCIERFLTMRGIAEELRASRRGRPRSTSRRAAPARAPFSFSRRRSRASAGFVAMLRGSGDSDESVVVDGGDGPRAPRRSIRAEGPAP